MEKLRDKKQTKIVNNRIWIHSAKKYCDICFKVPDNATFWKEVTGAIPKGIIAKEERKRGTVYHVHKVGGSCTFTGSHYMYLVKDERGIK